MSKINTSEAKEMLAKLDGKAPYDGPENICRNDGYFSRSIERKFGMSVAELRKAVR